MAATGSSSTATTRARGKRRPADTAKRPDPAPGSTTRAGGAPSAAQAIIDSTMAGGV